MYVFLNFHDSKIIIVFFSSISKAMYLLRFKSYNFCLCKSQKPKEVLCYHLFADFKHIITGWKSCLETYRLPSLLSLSTYFITTPKSCLQAYLILCIIFTSWNKLCLTVYQIPSFCRLLICPACWKKSYNCKLTVIVSPCGLLSTSLLLKRCYISKLPG